MSNYELGTATITEIVVRYFDKACVQRVNAKNPSPVQMKPVHREILYDKCKRRKITYKHNHALKKKIRNIFKLYGR